MPQLFFLLTFFTPALLQGENCAIVGKDASAIEGLQKEESHRQSGCLHFPTIMQGSQNGSLTRSPTPRSTMRSPSVSSGPNATGICTTARVPSVKARDVPVTSTHVETELFNVRGSSPRSLLRSGGTSAWSVWRLSYLPSRHRRRSLHDLRHQDLRERSRGDPYHQLHYESSTVTQTVPKLHRDSTRRVIETATTEEIFTAHDDVNVEVDSESTRPTTYPEAVPTLFSYSSDTLSETVSMQR
uniref:Uncharacterized protein n=1 Tax=Chromera velia CCMP2878 TaxID=1169474 RepID=A0A0G4GYS7_9ALVE|eukprot:Cvel_23948.t1-p1 / transcript=Cvel_23948.t1 / gene=Cvel_23948 / organism=Chromera_velia_CCMP2878 / gene_product=hypothetical protein / transcript_product=hypothetical protein / location=Cvel_scaffold2531:22039-23551(-) / protein_length=241 / sequence_SO=supercontig / SO=protein_coding / is_pseudo=false